MAEPILFPVWKKNASPVERLAEIAQYAQHHPEKFSAVVVVYVEEKPNGNTVTRYIGSENVNTFELLGILDSAKSEVNFNTQG